MPFCHSAIVVKVLKESHGTDINWCHGFIVTLFTTVLLMDATCIAPVRLVVFDTSTTLCKQQVMANGTELILLIYHSISWISTE